MTNLRRIGSLFLAFALAFTALATPRDALALKGPAFVHQPLIPLNRTVTSVTCTRLWQSDYGVTDDGTGHVSDWKDVISGAHLVQATSANRPQIVKNSISGQHTGILFDGVNDLLADTSITLPTMSVTPTTSLVNFKPVTWVGGAEFWVADTTPHMQFRQVTSTPGIGQSTTNSSATLNDGVLGTPIRAQTYFATANAFLKLGTSTSALYAGGNVAPTAGIYVGNLSNGTAPANFVLYSIMFCQNKPSSGEFTAWDNASGSMYAGLVR